MRYSEVYNKLFNLLNNLYNLELNDEKDIMNYFEVISQYITSDEDVRNLETLLNRTLKLIYWVKIDKSNELLFADEVDKNIQDIKKILGKYKLDRDFEVVPEGSKHDDINDRSNKRETRTNNQPVFIQAPLPNLVPAIDVVAGEVVIVPRGLPVNPKNGNVVVYLI